MRRIISIIDPDIKYADKLTDYINSHDTGGLKAVAFSDLNSFKRNSREYDTQILLVQEGELAGLHENDTGESLVMVLSEDGLTVRSDYRAVFKYSRGDLILRDVLKAYSEASTSERLVRVTNHKANITGIYSPLGSCGKTSFAICLSCALSKKGRVLLFNLDEFAGVFRYIAAEATSDLSDVIYAFRQGTYSWSRLTQSVYSFGSIDYIPPVRYAEDINAIDSGQMAELINTIAAEGGYDQLILDMGSYGKRAGDLMDICDRLFMPVSDSEVVRCKIEEFEESLVKSGFGEIVERIEEIRLPVDKRFERLVISSEEYVHGELYEYASAL